MKTFNFVVLLLLFSVPSVAHEKDGCDRDVVIKTIDEDVLLATFLRLKECVQEGHKPNVYVHGGGGPLIDAVDFFNLMRSSGVHKNVTFHYGGRSSSASNIVWLSASTRIGNPGSSFMLHEVTLNMSDEDHRTRTGDFNHLVKTSTDAVREATQNEATANLWEDVIQGNAQGMVIGAEEALEMGILTEIRKFKK